MTISTPNLDKINAHTWQIIHEFLEFLSENQISLAKYGEDPLMYPLDSMQRRDLIHKFFDTTFQACEKERRKLLELVRSKSE